MQKLDLTNDDFERFHVLGEKLEADVIKSREVPVEKKHGKFSGWEVGN